MRVIEACGGSVKRNIRPEPGFLQRGFDQIIHDVCRQNLPVVFALDRAGVVGEDGDTHQGVFDLGYFRIRSVFEVLKFPR